MAKKPYTAVELAVVENGSPYADPCYLLDPQTPAQWQGAVNAARWLLQVDAARQYGLVTGGPHVNVERCEDILKRGAKSGYQPRKFR